jgi:hypothetical protein
MALNRNTEVFGIAAVNTKPHPPPHIAELLFALPAQTALSATPGSEHSHWLSLLKADYI